MEINEPSEQSGYLNPPVESSLPEVVSVRYVHNLFEFQGRREDFLQILALNA